MKLRTIKNRFRRIRSGAAWSTFLGVFWGMVAYSLAWPFVAYGLRLILQ